MRLLIDVRSMGSNPSGVGIYAYNFIKALTQYEDLEIVLLSDVAESLQIQELQTLSNVTLRLYGKKVSKTVAVMGYFRFVQKMVHDVRADIFWEINNLIPVKIKNPYGRIIVTIHDVFPLYMQECYGKIYPYYFKYGISNTLDQVDAIIYNSYETKTETERYFPKAKKVNSFISYIIVEVCRNTRIADKNYYLYIGNLEKRKGTDILLNAYREYKKYGGTKGLLLAGKIREADIEELYTAISHEIDGIEYLGYANESMKDRLLAECSCFVFPTRAEGFGIPVVEALLYNKPVLASKLHIFDEVVGDMIKYVECSEVAAADSWANEMLQNDKEPYEVSYNNPYTADELGQKLYEFFGSLME